MPPTSRRRHGRGKAAPRRSKRRRRSFLWRWRRAFFLIGLLFIAGIAGLGYALAQIQLPPERIQAQTTFICAGDVASDCNAGNALAQLNGEQDRVNVKLADVPQVLIDAVLASEDRDFYSHGGVDPLGVVRALWHDVRNEGSTQGGSTITQQYVKNAYLTNERTLTRKINEAVLSIKLEQQFSKDQILERYLNTVYFGRGSYGVGAATRTWFGHDLATITLPEAAYLAGLIRSPESADATTNQKEATFRRNSVLQAMLETKKIDEKQLADAEALPWVGPEAAGSGLVVLKRTAKQGFGPARDAEHGTEYVRDYIYKELRNKGFSDAEIYGGGLRVYTTLDYHLQDAAWDAVTSTLDSPDDPLAGLVALDDKGHIVAMIGGTNYADTQVNVAVPPAVGGGSGWQPGSSFKPFILAEALRQGISLKSKFDAPATITIPNGNGPGNPWKPSNAEPSDQGVLDLIDATRESVNTVFAQLMVQVGPQNAVDLAKKMGITEDLPPVNSLVLGSGETSPLDMASAYSTFAQRGTHIAPTIITRVERPDGSVKLLDQAPQKVLDEHIADQVTYCLQKVVQSGTGTGANFGTPIAGKTGTTDKFRNAWFVGYAPNGFTTAVAMGYEPTKDADGTLHARFMTDVHGQRVFGGTLPATIWRKFMQAALDGVDVGSFASPGSFDGRVLGTDLTTTTESTSTTEASTTTAPTASSVTLPPTTAAPPTTIPHSTTAPTTTSPPSGGGGGGTVPVNGPSP
ncbi:MAG: penicillin-binding protein [Acidimicrobiaceae bacterium]